MEKQMQGQLKELIRAQIKKSISPEYQSRATDEQALGIMLSQYFEWDGLALLKVAYAALEDANFHAENREIEKMIQRIEKI